MATVVCGEGLQDNVCLCLGVLGFQGWETCSEQGQVPHLLHLSTVPLKQLDICSLVKPVALT